MSCALRALNLCDGQALQEPSGALAECLCGAIAWLEDHAAERLVQDRREELQKLIEQTMTAPQLPLLP